MKKIIAFSGSNNPASINEKLIKYIIKEFPNGGIEFVDLKEYELPIYSQEIEQKGIPDRAKELFQRFITAEGFILASPEHNGLPTAFLKNTIDWLSRIDQRFFGDKPIFLLSASPGASGGSSHLEILGKLVPRWGGQFVGRFSIGNFQRYFNEDTESLHSIKEAYLLKNLVKRLLTNEPLGGGDASKDVDQLMDEITTRLKSKGFL